MRQLSSSSTPKETCIQDNFRPPCLVGNRKVAIIKDTNVIKKTNETSKERKFKLNPSNKYSYNKLLDYIKHPIFVPTLCTAILSTWIPVGLFLWYKK